MEHRRLGDLEVSLVGLGCNNFGSRMDGQGPFADQIHGLFAMACKRSGLGGWPELSTAAFRRPTNQPSLFDR